MSGGRPSPGAAWPGSYWSSLGRGTFPWFLILGPGTEDPWHAWRPRGPQNLCLGTGRPRPILHLSGGFHTHVCLQAGHVAPTALATLSLPAEAEFQAGPTPTPASCTVTVPAPQDTEPRASQCHVPHNLVLFPTSSVASSSSPPSLGWPVPSVRWEHHPHLLRPAEPLTRVSAWGLGWLCHYRALHVRPAARVSTSSRLQGGLAHPSPSPPWRLQCPLEGQLVTRPLPCLWLRGADLSLGWPLRMSGEGALVPLGPP